MPAFFKRVRSFLFPVLSVTSIDPKLKRYQGVPLLPILPISPFPWQAMRQSQEVPVLQGSLYKLKTGLLRTAWHKR